MAYDPTQFNEGGPPGLSAAEMNKLGGQYDEVKSELGTEDGDIEVHGSNIKDGSVDDSKLSDPRKFAVGSYVGDRANEKVINVGFYPQLVIVRPESKTASADNVGVRITRTGQWRFEGLSGTGNFVNLGIMPIDNSLVAMTAQGFKVGYDSQNADNRAGNLQDITYQWEAWG